MTTTNPLTTSVFIDGVRAFDSVADLESGNPTVLDGITISWGRATTVDQPETGSCSLTIRQQLDPTPSQTLFDDIHVGSEIEIWVAGTLNPPNPPGNETMSHTNFLADPTGPFDPTLWAAVGMSATPATVNVASRFGRRAAFIDVPSAPSWSGSIGFPPLPFAPAGVNDAWDHVPKLLPGGTWQLSATVMVPAGTGPSRLRAAARNIPQSTGTWTWYDVLNPDGRQVIIPADGAWHTLSGTVTLPASYPDPSGAWIVPGMYLQNMPDSTTWAASLGPWTDHQEAWFDHRRAALATISVLQTAATARTVLVWAGLVTAVHVKPAGDQAVVLEASASDPSAALANNTIGDEPWPHNQSLIARANRIQTLAHDDLDLVVDTGLRNVRVAYKDIDAQPVLGLLQDLATTGGGVLWTAAHARQGPYLWMEDPNGRTSAFIFVIDPTTGLVTIGGNAGATAVISSWDVLLEPLDAAQDSTNVITSVDVTWQLLTGTDPETNQPVLEEQTVTETEDETTERFKRFGLITQSITTDLTSEVDADNRAALQLEQARASDWQLNGVTVDTRVLSRPIPALDDQTRIGVILDLLDGLVRLGLAITLLDMPSWLPADVASTLYVEGGSYTLSNGHWELGLVVVPAGSLGHSATWAEMPTSVKWSDMSKTISWADAFGVAAPAA